MLPNSDSALSATAIAVDFEHESDIPMTTIAAKTALAMIANDQAVIIDVREPAEFRDGHLPTAVNIPSTSYQVETYREFGDRAICLVCQTGRRASSVADKLQQHGIANVFLLEQQMAVLADVGAGVYGAKTGWSIDRQFRMVLGLLLAIFLLGYFLWSAAFLVIPVILCLGLINAAITDNCYLRMGIAMLPWNRRCTTDLPKQNAYHHATFANRDAL
jgi:rhodanese-related sulfurtransferase